MERARGKATILFHLLWLAVIWLALRAVTDLETGLRTAIVAMSWVALVVLGVARSGVV